MEQKKKSAAKPPDKPFAQESIPGVTQDGSAQGCALEQGMEILDNSSPTGPWKEAYLELFKRD